MSLGRSDLTTQRYFFIFVFLLNPPIPSSPPTRHSRPILFQPPNPDWIPTGLVAKQSRGQEGGSLSHPFCSGPVAWPNVFAILGHRQEGPAVKAKKPMGKSAQPGFFGFLVFWVLFCLFLIGSQELPLSTGCVSSCASSLCLLTSTSSASG